MLDRFEQYFDKVAGCWEWQASKSNGGYGTFAVKMNGKFRTTGAHRVAYQLYISPIESGMCVLHACDNPGCVNPKHLYQGTHKDNTQDMMAKGRHHSQKHNNTPAALRYPYPQPT